MYGKFFRACFQGSMVGAGDHVFAVWAYAISHAVKSRVELNPDYLWRVIGSTKEKMVAAIEYLSQPDPGSRHDEHEGRRLVKEGAYQYFLPQFERYQKIKNNDDLREQNRIRQARHREKKKTQPIEKDPIESAPPGKVKAVLGGILQKAVEQNPELAAELGVTTPLQPDLRTTRIED